MKTSALTIERVRELLNYDPESGLLTWRVKTGKMSAGKLAGMTPKGDRLYLAIGIDGVVYHTHRVIFMHTFGRMPSNEIDHIDGNRQNNRISNLREATHAQNQYNKRDAVGVRFHPPSQKWQARIGINRREIHLGLFDTKEEALIARRQGELHYFGEFAKRPAPPVRWE